MVPPFYSTKQSGKRRKGRKKEKEGQEVELQGQCQASWEGHTSLEFA